MNIERMRIERLKEINNLVGRNIVENSYILTNEQKGTNVDISNNVEYVQIAYKEEQETKFKNVNISDFV